MLIYVLTAVSIFQGFVLLFLLYRTGKEKRAIDGLFNTCESHLEIFKLIDQVYLTETILSKKLSIRIALVRKKNCCGESYHEQVVQLLFDENVISEESLGR